MVFTKEAVEQILAVQDDGNEKKVESLLALYEEDLNGLRMNRDELKKEKQAFQAKVEELTAANQKGAEDYAALQKQLEANSPDEIKKAYEQKQAELEGTYKGVLDTKESTIKKLTEDLAISKASEHKLFCLQAFNKASEKYDIEPSSREYLFNSVFGQNGSNFSIQNFGEGDQLLNKDGQTVDIALRKFLDTDFGKKFIRNLSSGGGAGTNGDGNNQPLKNPFKKETLNLTEQARLIKENPELAKQMKAAANA
jgi:hypothetical protein